MQRHGALFLDVLVEPTFQENCYVLWVDSGEAWIVDPGFPPTPARVLDMLNTRQLRPSAIVLTHGHLDHMAGVDLLRAAVEGLPLIAPADEQHMLTDPSANLSAGTGFPIAIAPATRVLRAGDTLALGPLHWTALDVAGHSPGGLAYHCADAGVVLSGDALFAGSVGRTDFPGSSSTRLIRNIKDNLLSLADNTVVYSGHGPPTTIGEERRGNPFINGGWRQ